VRTQRRAGSQRVLSTCRAQPGDPVAVADRRIAAIRAEFSALKTNETKLEKELQQADREKARCSRRSPLSSIAAHAWTAQSELAAQNARLKDGVDSAVARVRVQSQHVHGEFSERRGCRLRS
jgi:hypothetical protein